MTHVYKVRDRKPALQDGLLSRLSFRRNRLDADSLGALIRLFKLDPDAYFGGNLMSEVKKVS